jgi:hypothetical protein
MFRYSCSTALLPYESNTILRTSENINPANQHNTLEDVTRSALSVIPPVRRMFIYLSVALSVGKCTREDIRRNLFYIFMQNRKFTVFLKIQRNRCFIFRKCSLFHNFIFLCSSNTHVFHKLCAKIYIPTPVGQRFIITLPLSDYMAQSS